MFFDSRLNWIKKINELVNKARRSSFLLKSIYKGRTAIKSSTLINLYKAVLSNLDYGGILMADHSKSPLKKIDVVQNDILRLITKTRLSTPITAWKLEKGVIPLDSQRQWLGEKYIIKLIHSRINPMVFQRLEKIVKSKTSWKARSTIKRIFFFLNQIGPFLTV